jgi:uncharacterized protein
LEEHERLMQRIEGQLVFSPTDLVGYLACEHLTELERAAAMGLVKRPVIPDSELDLIVRRGFEHEARIRAEFEASGRAVTAIEPDASITDQAAKLREAASRTLEAMRRGDEVIYQAAFFDGRWRGFADFLVRTDEGSDLGPWSYEVTDAKLARHTKAGTVLQLCSYSDQVARLQGRAPETMRVALGGRDAPLEALRVADYAAYFRLVKSRFEAAALREEPPAYPPAATYPDPVEHCEVCRWRIVCARRRRADDDLSLVAGIYARQKTELKARGVPSRRGLARLPIPLDPPPEHGTALAWERVREQARIQVQGEDQGRALYELLEPSRLDDGSLEPDRGLLVLPEPSPGDLFFDIEGDPFVSDEGLEYLFGVIEPGLPGGKPALPDADGGPTYHAFWATDRDGEKAAFERLIDFVVERLERDPGLHVYHYAPYEPSAIKRLMGRHGTRETEVDRLLRGGVFVDLFRAVRQGLRASGKRREDSCGERDAA